MAPIFRGVSPEMRSIVALVDISTGPRSTSFGGRDDRISTLDTRGLLGVTSLMAAIISVVGVFVAIRLVLT